LSIIFLFLKLYGNQKFLQILDSNRSTKKAVFFNEETGVKIVYRRFNKGKGC
jgi:hypothetical protein